MDLSNFSGKLKDILQNYYLINYTSPKSWHNVKSMQLIGTRKKDNKTLGRFTMTKKRPNLLKYKYHSYKDGINLILYDGKEAWIKRPKEDWSNIISDELKLDALFDSHLLNPSEKNKTIELGEKYYIKDSLIQVIIVKLEDTRLEYHLDIQTSLINKMSIKNNANDDLNTFFFSNYEKINDIMFPRKMTFEKNQEVIYTKVISNIYINKGVLNSSFKRNKYIEF